MKIIVALHFNVELTGINLTDTVLHGVESELKSQIDNCLLFDIKTLHNNIRYYLELELKKLKQNPFLMPIDYSQYDVMVDQISDGVNGR